MNSYSDEMDIDIEVRRRGNQYVFIAHQYGVVVRSKELKSGIEELQRRVAIIGEDFREAGIMAPPGPVARANNETSGRLAPSLKQLIPSLIIIVTVVIMLVSVVVVTVVPIVAALASVRSAISAIVPAEGGSSIARVGRFGIDFVIKVSQTLDQVTPERKEELRTAIRKIAREMGSLIEDVKAAPPSSPQPPSNGDKR